MGITTEWIRYGAGGAQLGYLARVERAAGPMPAVLVFQEAWGVDEHIQDVARRMAQAGYVALAPDLFAVSGVRPEPLRAERMTELKAFMDRMPLGAWGDAAQRDAAFAKEPDGLRQRLAESFGVMAGGLQPGKYVPALLEASAYLRKEHPASRGQKIGAMGFCLGGGLAALLACHDPELAGAAIFYGSVPPDELIAHIRCPVLGFYGGADQRINAGLPAFTERMKKEGKSFEPHVYPGAPHAFFNDTRASYRADAARDSFARLLSFFARVLVG